MSNPFVGQIVHYVSFGTPKGEYQSMCRAAMVTEVGQWVTMTTAEPKSFAPSEGRPIRTLEQWWFDDAAMLAVINPTGMFFNGAGAVLCQHNEDEHVGGSWHTREGCSS